MLSPLCHLVYKHKKHDNPPKRPAAKEEAEPVYIPVVGESEPELKAANTAETHKRKLDQSQLATDDYCYDKFRKKTRHY